MKCRLLVLLILATAMTGACAEPTLFIVRHAEKADSKEKDPDLSEAGRARAQALVRLLKDAKITAIYATAFKRTQETAAPLAQALGLAVTVLPSAPAALLERVRETSGNVLIVGHGNTLPDLIKTLCPPSQIKISEDDYDNLFIVSPGDKPQLIRLHYSL